MILEVQVFDWTPEIVGIVSGSDGIWEKVPNNIVAAICEKYYEDKDAKGASNELLNRAMIKWKTVKIRPFF